MKEGPARFVRYFERSAAAWGFGRIDASEPITNFAKARYRALSCGAIVIFAREPSR